MHFIDDILAMTDACNIRRDVVAQLIFAGRQAELVAALAKRCDGAQDLREKADDFSLPERFKADYAGFRAHVRNAEREL